MPPDPPSKSASGAQQDLGLNEHPYRNLSYAPVLVVRLLFLMANRKLLTTVRPHSSLLVKFFWILKLSFFKDAQALTVWSHLLSTSVKLLRVFILEILTSRAMMLFSCIMVIG